MIYPFGLEKRVSCFARYTVQNSKSVIACNYNPILNSKSILPTPALEPSFNNSFTNEPANQRQYYMCTVCVKRLL